MTQEMKRRIMMLANLARVVSQNDSGNVQMAQVQTPLDVRPDTLRFAEFGFSSGLPPGSDVIVLSVGGDRSSQVVIASNHNGLRFKNLKPGEVVIYNEWGQYIKLTEDKIEVEANGKDVIVLSIGGDRSSQVAIASNHNGFRLTGLKSGEVAVYNQWGQYIKLTEDKIEVEAGGKDVIVNNANNVTVQASTVKIEATKTTITGDLTVSGTTTTSGLNAGSGGGKSTFAGDIEHTSGKITSLGRKIDGSHVHSVPQGGNTGAPQ